jgi:hypothetical protein
MMRHFLFFYFISNIKMTKLPLKSNFLSLILDGVSVILMSFFLLLLSWVMKIQYFFHLKKIL